MDKNELDMKLQMIQYIYKTNKIYFLFKYSSVFLLLLGMARCQVLPC